MFMRRVRMMGVGGGARPPPSNEDMAEKYGIGVKTEPEHLAANITNLKPEMVAIFPDIAKIWNEHNVKPFITSGNDYAPGRVPNSLHYEDLAIDLRTNYLDDSKQNEMADDLQELLGDNYDVISEHKPNSALDHIHIEYQLKPGMQIK